MNKHEQEAAYRLAALDQDFILGDSMRGARFMMEYTKAEQHLRAQKILSTIVVFGSARVRDDGNEWQARVYAAAREFGRLASARGGALAENDGWRTNVIATGGGAVTIGFNIALPFEQEPNPYITPELCLQFHYFAMRKMHLAMRARALVVFPGGFGTLDELFELLTLNQTGKSPKMPVVLYDRAFWNKIVNFEALVDAGVIAETDLTRFDFADDAEEAWESLLSQGLSTNEETESGAEIAVLSGWEPSGLM